MEVRRRVTKFATDVTALVPEESLARACALQKDAVKIDELRGEMESLTVNIHETNPGLGNAPRELQNTNDQEILTLHEPNLQKLEVYTRECEVLTSTKLRKQLRRRGKCQEEQARP